MSRINRIVEVKMSLMSNGYWSVAVTKEFASEYGGGSQTFTEVAGSAHHALDVARGMVTLSPGARTDLPLLDPATHVADFEPKTGER